MHCAVALPDTPPYYVDEDATPYSQRHFMPSLSLYAATPLPPYLRVTPLLLRAAIILRRLLRLSLITIVFRYAAADLRNMRLSDITLLLCRFCRYADDHAADGHSLRHV